MGQATPPYSRGADRTPVAVAVEVVPLGDAPAAGNPATAGRKRAGGKATARERPARKRPAKKITGTTRDVGMGGFSMVVAEPLPVGTRVAAEVRLGEDPDATRIQAECQVVWVRGEAMGVAFTATDAANRKKLSDRFLCNPMAPGWD